MYVRVLQYWHVGVKALHLIILYLVPSNEQEATGAVQSKVFNKTSVHQHEYCCITKLANKGS